MRRVALGLVAAVVALAVPTVATAPVGAANGEDAQRALAGYAAMQRYLVDPRTGEYRETVGGRAGAHAWPVSQALAATIAIASVGRPSVLHGVRAHLARLRTGPVYAASPGGDVYWDDNEWIAQDLLALGDSADVRRARAIFAAIVGAWDTDATKPCAGGVQWTDAPGNDDRNTVSTVNGALVGLELYARTSSPAVLYWSRKMLDWIDACMIADDGLTLDHIDGAGDVDPTHWSYNQGSLIGALVLLAHETGDTTALARAEQLADRTLAYFSDRWLDGEPPEFAAIFFCNLLSLAAADGRSDYVAAAQRYADAAYAQRRNPRTGLYSFGGPTRLLDQAALVQVYAALATAGR